MPVDVRTAESAWLKGQARFKRWQRKFLQQWYGPYLDRQVIAMYDRMPEEVKAEMRRRMGAEFTAFERRVEAIRSGGVHA